jgi:cell wall-associated NlpC family hydrolase
MKFSEIITKSLGASIFLALVIFAFSFEVDAQERDRVVPPSKTTNKDNKTRPTTQIPASPRSGRQVLTNEIEVKESPQSLVRKTSQSQIRTVSKAPTSKPTARRSIAYSATAQSMMFNSIRKKIGIPYRLGTQGPNRYDCSGFVWKVFQEAGMPFTRTSAREFWRTFEPVYGDDRFEFGTLVFFNRLGHVGIVVNEEGFYHASSSKGVTYSKFAGYWSKRIVGYRRIPVANFGWDNNFEDEDPDNN